LALHWGAFRYSARGTNCKYIDRKLRIINLFCII
jgi:hypothetical protein